MAYSRDGCDLGAKSKCLVLSDANDTSYYEVSLGLRVDDAGD